MNEVRDAVRALLNGRESRAADGSQDAGAARAAFTELAANGWTRVGLSEALGGTGGTLADAADVAAAATYCGAATPLADQVLIANAAADLLDITLPGGTACVVPVIADAGRAVRVPWASWATYMLVADSAGGIGLVAAGSARVTPGANIGGLPSDTVELDGPIPGAGGTIAAALIAQLGALARSVQIAAALRRCSGPQRRLRSPAPTVRPATSRPACRSAGDRGAGRRGHCSGRRCPGGRPGGFVQHRGFDAAERRAGGGDERESPGRPRGDHGPTQRPPVARRYGYHQRVRAARPHTLGVGLARRVWCRAHLGGTTWRCPPGVP